MRLPGFLVVFLGVGVPVFRCSGLQGFGRSGVQAFRSAPAPETRTPKPPNTPTPEPLNARTPERLNREIARRAFDFFRNETDPHTGLTKDRARLNGGDHYTVASIAATGYALSALPVGVEVVA